MREVVRLVAFTPIVLDRQMCLVAPLGWVDSGGSCLEVAHIMPSSDLHESRPVSGLPMVFSEYVPARTETEKSDKQAPVPGSDAYSESWYRDLSIPREVCLVQTEQGAVPSDRVTKSKKPESTARFLYRGNFRNYGMATAATVVSAGFSAMVAVATSHYGSSTALSAVAAAAASYIWHPVYLALNNHFHDRAMLERRKREGVRGSSARMWGSRGTQLIIGEGVWLGFYIGVQLLLRHRFGINPGLAALSSHISLALLLNATLLTPIRNCSNWLWGIDRPARPGRPRDLNQ